MPLYGVSQSRMHHFSARGESETIASRATLTKALNFNSTQINYCNITGEREEREGEEGEAAKVYVRECESGAQ